MSESVRDVVDKLGGLAAAAALAEVDRKTVSAWQTWKGSFPANTYLLFTTELRRRGVRKLPPPSLWGMKERRRRQPISA